MIDLIDKSIIYTDYSTLYSLLWTMSNSKYWFGKVIMLIAEMSNTQASGGWITPLVV
jgi:hypothetical protein